MVPAYAVSKAQRRGYGCSAIALSRILGEHRSRLWEKVHWRRMVSQSGYEVLRTEGWIGRSEHKPQRNSVGGVTNQGLNALHHALSENQDYIAFNS